MYSKTTYSGWISRSHRAIPSFKLARPNSVTEAVNLLTGKRDATVIAGGVDVVRRMRSGHEWSTLIDIGGIEELKTITLEGDFIRIGALATHWDIERAVILNKYLPFFQKAWTTIGNIRVRMAGTIGGNIMANDAGYDGRVILGVLGAELEFMTGTGETLIPANGSSRKPASDALLAGIKVPISSNRRMILDRSLKPTISVAVSLDEDRYVIGVGCGYSEPEFQSGVGPVDAVGVSLGLPEPIDNPLGSGSYRRRMAGVLAARAYRALKDEGLNDVR